MIFNLRGAIHCYEIILLHTLNIVLDNQQKVVSSFYHYYNPIALETFFLLVDLLNLYIHQYLSDSLTRAKENTHIECCFSKPNLF